MIRVSGQILRRDGFTKNLFDNSRTDNERKTSFRASVVIRPFEWLENYFIYQYTHINEAGHGAAIGGFTPASPNPRSEERRVGKDAARTFRSRWSPFP